MKSRSLPRSHGETRSEKRSCVGAKNTRHLFIGLLSAKTMQC